MQIQAVIALQHKRATVSATTMGSILLEEMNYYLLIFSFLGFGNKSNTVSSATQHAMPRKFDGMWGTECLNTKSPLPYTGYSMNLKKKQQPFCLKLKRGQHCTSQKGFQLGTIIYIYLLFQQYSTTICSHSLNNNILKQSNKKVLAAKRNE